MTLTATAFAVKERRSDEAIGFGLLAADARYCSVLWRGADRIDRRFATVEDWKAIEEALGTTLQTSPFPPGGTIACVVAGEHLGSIVSWLWRRMSRLTSLNTPHQR